MRDGLSACGGSGGKARLLICLFANLLYRRVTQRRHGDTQREQNTEYRISNSPLLSKFSRKGAESQSYLSIQVLDGLLTRLWLVSGVSRGVMRDCWFLRFLL